MKLQLKNVDQCKIGNKYNKYKYVSKSHRPSKDKIISQLLKKLAKIISILLP